MKTQMWKRCFAMLLAVVMTVGAVPVQVFATETHDHVHEESEAVLQEVEVVVETAAETTPAEETEAAALAETEAPVETEAVPETEAVVETEAVIETEAVVETEPVVETEAVVETEPVVETEAVVETEPVVETEAVVETEPVVETEAAVETEPAETVAETKPEETEAVVETTEEEIEETAEAVVENEAEAASVSVTVTYNSALGTVKSGSAAVAPGTTATVESLTAAANSGAAFLGWVNAADNTILSTSATYTPDANAKVIAAFASASTNAWFRVGTKYLYNDLNAAASNSEAASLMVILAADGTLPAGDYTIPKGVTLLIPFDAADTCYTNVPAADAGDRVKPTAYRTLHMASGANLTVNGVLSLSAKHRVVTSSATGGAPNGPTSFVNMASGAAISVNGTLYAYGYITGSGSVAINKGGTVYENFMVTDFRGGSATLAMADLVNGVFPLSQYYVQNVEVPMTLYAGATEYSYTTLRMLETNFGSSVAFIAGEGAMFNLKSGSVTKRYDGATDRLVLEANGEIDISPITMELAANASIDSGDFVLPINGNFSVRINSGSVINIKQQIAMLPGAEIVVSKGATCNLTADAIVYDRDDWGNYCGSINMYFAPLDYAPGRTHNRTAEELADAKIVAEGALVASSGHVYTTSGKANIIGGEGTYANVTPGTKTKTYQVSQIDTNVSVVEIPITPAQLKNADGSYTDTSVAGGFYKYSDGRWHTVACGAQVTTTVTKEATCTETGLKTVACACAAGHEETIPAKGHTEITVPGKAATCKTPGLTDGKKCAVCGTVTVAQETIATGDHVWGEMIVTNAATCSREGDGYKTCSECGTNSETLTIEKLPHTEQVVPAVEATCKAEGTSEYTICSVCKTNITEPTVTPKTDHDYDRVVTTEATCTGTGFARNTCNDCGYSYDETIPMAPHTEKVMVEGWDADCLNEGMTDLVQCEVCKKVITEQTVIPVTDCTPGEAEIENEEAATCTTAGSYDSVTYCTVCYEEVSRETVIVEALGHNTQVISGKDATCTETGLTDGFYCDVCKETLKEQAEIPAKGHSLGAWTETKAPSCTEAGEEKRECSACDYAETQEVKAIGHDYKSVVTAPTCTDKGYTTYTCGNCGDSYTDNEVAATGHSLGAWTETKAPTCTEAGEDKRECSACDYAETREVAAKGHDYKSEVTKAATCTATGVMTYTCACGDSYTEEIPMAEHSWQSFGKEPTCTETGLTAASTCSVCGAEGAAGEVIPAKGHSWGDWTQTKAPSCTEVGEKTRECSVCDAAETQEVAAAGHTEVNVAGKDATCTETGLTNGVQCAACEEIITAQTEIPMLAHAWNDGVISTPASCKAEGVKTFTCTACNTTKAEAVAKLNHTEGAAIVENKVEATCTTAGSYDSVVKCSVCGEELSRETVTVAALGHTEVTVAGKAATCTEAGLTDGVKCSVCGETITAQTEIPAKGHAEKTTKGKAATCENTGLTDKKECTVCGTVTLEQTEIPALGHAWNDGEVTTAATCTGTGVKTFTCGTCGKIRTEEIEALGHTEETVAGKAATCTEAGLSDGKKCTVCTMTTVAQEEIPALGHTEEVVAAVAPTCTATGLTEGKKCSVCQTVTEEQRVVAPAGHTDEVVAGKEPTCTETGLTEGYKCSVCGETTTAQTEIPALGHTEETLAAVEATCTATGLTEGKKCLICGETTVEQTVVEQLPHDFGTGVITKDPDCVTDGEREFTCSVCQTQKTEVEKALGHELVQVDAKRPTYTDYGWEAYEYCTRDDCGHSTQVMLEPLGEAKIETYEEFLKNLEILEEIADYYTRKVAPGKDPLTLIIKYIRTGVDRYNSGSWQIMAGYEDADFAAYVKQYEDEYNANLADDQEMMAVTGMKNIEEFFLLNGDRADLGHMFGTMDISNTNASNANVGGWAGDLCDLLCLVEQFGVTATDIEGMVKEITEKYFLWYEEDLVAHYGEELVEGTFSQADVYGDLDAFYIMQQLDKQEYENGTLTEIIRNYLTSSLTMKKRASYFLNNKLGGVTLRSDIRDAVYSTYTTDGGVKTLEGTRELTMSNLEDVKLAVCYVFADYLCKLAGDYVEAPADDFLEVYQSFSSTLAPGVTQKIHYANTKDGKTLVYYTATADLTRDDLTVYANYHNSDPSQGWAMQRVLDQANAAQARYGDPNSPEYEENYTVIAGINGAGYDMATGEPGGLLTMRGVEWHPSTGHSEHDFFGILTDGTPIIASHAEYERLHAEGKVSEAISAFGTPLVKDGKIHITATSDYYTNRAGRTAVGITASGKVVFMVADGRQYEFSCGGSMEEIAEIMLEAGCVDAINLDGGGSSTYIAKPEGSDTLAVVSSPSDGAARSVSTSLIMVSTAPSSNTFDHAVLDSKYAYLTVGASTNFEATAVSATGNGVEMPEGTSWVVEDPSIGTITADGVFTAKAEGQTVVKLMLDGNAVGTKKVYVVTPDNVNFEKDSVYAIYGDEVNLPVRAFYEGKRVAILEKDVVLSLENTNSGTISGFTFVGNEASRLKQAKVIVALANDPKVTASMVITLYSRDEASFDFDNATSGDRQFAWLREVSNSTMESSNTYRVQDAAKDMVTSYTFAIDMSKIDMPAQLEDLTYMLPGADLEDACAWNFLLQLAERVSVLTYVQPVIKIDPNFDVDYSNMTVANEYFQLTNTEFNAETNELKLTLNFIDQTDPIDPDTANPMCILSGIKLTPKANANWGDKNQMTVVNQGVINYRIYLRTSALYTFSSKPENQKVYGLYAFVNPNDESEKGGYFESTYKDFADQYTLINAYKDGWVAETDGFAYYRDGEKVTGVQEIEGKFYDFGTNGINAGKKVYTGEYFDAQGNEYFITNGVKWYGWDIRGVEYVRYYNETTGIREELAKDEVPTTCLYDGHCTYTSESGATKYVQYDDAGGHEYKKQADGSYVCAYCGYVRVNMADAKVELSFTETTYNGKEKKPTVTAYAPDGTKLGRKGATAKGIKHDYKVDYSNNVEVGSATVTLTAAKWFTYGDINDWFGNAAGSVDVTFDILPDRPTNIKASVASNGTATISWTAAKAPGAEYVIYRSKDGVNWTEYATTSNTSYKVKASAYTGYGFKVGSRCVVDGKNYDSSNTTVAVYVVPQVTVGTNTKNGKPMLTWPKVYGAVKYEIHRATSKTGKYTKLTTQKGTTYTNTSAETGKTYYYKVCAVDANGKTSAFSPVVQRICKLASPAVNITVDQTTGKIKLSWDAVKGAVKYQVYRSTTGKDGSFKRITTIKGTSYTNTSAEAGKTYYYKVKAVYSKTSANSEFSAVVNATCTLAKPVVKVTNDAATGRPKLTWEKVAGAVKYEVYRATAKNGKYTKIATTKNTYQLNKNAVAGKTYYYKVKAIHENAEANSAFSKVVNRLCDLARPEVTVSNVATSGKPKLTWEKVSGAAKYEVYRSTTGKDGSFKRIATVTGTSKTDKTAVAGKTYYYKVKAVHTNVNANSVLSASKKCVCDLARPTLTVALSSGKPKLTWEKVSGAAKYEIYRSTTGKDGSFKRIATVTGTSKIDKTAVAGKTYYYKVKAIHSNTNANSAFSAAKMIKSK